ncbi:hypothetical protein Y032_0095g2805 [Ancylostoma ceylanicum]|uniref:G-protein coupled receptors family 1 profile domain-containing protein n=1 Tax=Ancylostoma ceylanicum TaxID=53326 RepID=A0A016TKG3_9BILA|nr:hypothetical protein Y032_0095g2805 [Ancylostoma ceylanicum]
MNCTEAYQLTTSPIFLAAVASQAIAGLLSAIISVIVLRQCGYLHFHSNCKILIVAMLALYIVHSISITVLQTSQFIRYTTISNPCDVGLPPVICICLRLPATACMISFSSLLFAILVERTVAFWKRRDYDTFGPHIGYAFTAICVVISLSSTYWAASVMDLEERTTFCSTATSRTADRVTLLAFAISGVNIITLVGILTLFAFNKSAAARRGYDLQTSYQLRENVHVIRIILPLSMFQAFCYALFSIPSGMVSMFRDRMSMVEYRTIFTIAYAIPYYTVGAPVLISFIIKRSQQIKAAKLVKLTRPAGRDDEIYFQAYTGMWKNVPAPKK